jgi:hypothetical protein
MLGILISMAFIPAQQIPLEFGLISLALLVVGYAGRVRFGRKR